MRALRVATKPAVAHRAQGFGDDVKELRVSVALAMKEASGFQGVEVLHHGEARRREVADEGLGRHRAVRMKKLEDEEAIGIAQRPKDPFDLGEAARCQRHTARSAPSATAEMTS